MMKREGYLYLDLYFPISTWVIKCVPLWIQVPRIQVLEFCFRITFSIILNFVVTRTCHQTELVSRYNFRQQNNFKNNSKRLMTFIDILVTVPSVLWPHKPSSFRLAVHIVVENHRNWPKMANLYQKLDLIRINGF